MTVHRIRFALAIFCSFAVVSSVFGSQIEENESRYLRRDRAEILKRDEMVGETRFLSEVRRLFISIIED
jgi:hypothetical protein